MTSTSFTYPSGAREIDVHLAIPEGAATPRAAVVVVHEILGRDAHMLDVAGRFAKAGYVAAAPELLPADVRARLTPAGVGAAMASLAGAPPDLRRDPARLAAFAATQPEERRPVLEALARVSGPSAHAAFARDLRALTPYLASRPEVDGARLGAVGFCFGGGLVGRLATIEPALRAAVVFYGQNPPLEEVGNIRAAVLGLYGGEDPGITSTVPDLERAMRAADKHFELHVYPGARHAFFNDTRPNYHGPSAEDAWTRVLAFFDTYLRA